MSTDATEAAISAVDALMIGCVSAYVDESGRTSGAGLYVMAAVVVPPARAEEIRSAFRDGLPRGLRRYHWRDEGAASRTAMTRRVRDLHLDAVAVTTSPVEPRKTERARRHCLLRLLWELDQREVRHVVLEGRQRADALDRQLILTAQHGGRVRRDLGYEFRRPLAEPLLWLPDIVAGGVTRKIGDGDPIYVDLLGRRLEIVSVP